MLSQVILKAYLPTHLSMVLPTGVPTQTMTATFGQVSGFNIPMILPSIHWEFSTRFIMVKT